jgi:hypothetical protein
MDKTNKLILQKIHRGRHAGDDFIARSRHPLNKTNRQKMDKNGQTALAEKTSAPSRWG